MFTIALITNFTAFYITYLLSNKVKHTESHTLKQFITKGKLVSKIVALILLLISSLIFCQHLGTLAGILTSFFAISMFGCLQILLTPIKQLSKKLLFTAFILFFILELIIT
jgi:hypothetical protein